MDKKYTQKEFLDFSKEMHDKAHAITSVKNTDYSPGENPFSNFEKLSGLFGADWPVKLIVGRMHEKLDRITNFVVNGRSESNSEPLENDVLDLANYGIIFLAYTKTHDLQNNKK